jgi:hypothetical protein
VDALRRRVSREGFTRIALRCSPHRQSSAFGPVIAHLEQLLQFRSDDTPEGKFAKLERVLGAYRFPRADTVPLFATLLSVPLPADVLPSRLTPEQQKQHTQHDLVAWMTEEAEQKALLTVWEDVQWLDPSSLEVAELLLDQIPTVPMLMVVTCRPEFRSPWGMRSHLTPIMLGNLGRGHVETIATHAAGGKRLPAALVAQIMPAARIATGPSDIRCWRGTRRCGSTPRRKPRYLTTKRSPWRAASRTRPSPGGCRSTPFSSSRRSAARARIWRGISILAWPAISPPSSPTSAGVVQPHSLMLAAIAAI